jgi:hypothetical protein
VNRANHLSVKFMTALSKLQFRNIPHPSALMPLFGPNAQLNKKLTCVNLFSCAALFLSGRAEQGHFLLDAMEDNFVEQYKHTYTSGKISIC